MFLGLVTQRPAELDATIISQCSTLFAMRMANERDQAIIRSAVSDAAASLLGFVPSLGTREVFAFGEGVALPTRLRFSELAAEPIPKSESVSSGKIDPAQRRCRLHRRVVERWRGATMGNKQKPGETAQGNAMPAPEPGGTSPLEDERPLLRAATLPAGSLPPPPAPARRESDVRSKCAAEIAGPDRVQLGPVVDILNRDWKLRSMNGAKWLRINKDLLNPTHCPGLPRLIQEYETFGFVLTGSGCFLE